MTHTYRISGMTCAGCQAKVRELLLKVDGVKNVAIDLSKSEASVDMERHIQESELKNALQKYPKYQLTESIHHHHHTNIDTGEEAKTWFEIYKPLLLICAYILGITVLLQAVSGSFNWGMWMQHFMAAFFLVFSFFKLLNLSGFADTYSTYDIVASRWRAWGYVYAFIELALGIAFLVGFYPVLTNAVTFIVMTISIIGVLQSVLNKRKIKCACLGDVFNLPMSTVTIVEDAMMIGMSFAMLMMTLG